MRAGNKADMKKDNVPLKPLCEKKRERCWQYFTYAGSWFGPHGSEDNAGDEDKSSNQQEGDKIENDQEPKEDEIRLDTTSKVPCRVKESEVWGVSQSVFHLGSAADISDAYLQSFARICPTERKGKETLWQCCWIYAEIWSFCVSRILRWTEQGPPLTDSS